MLIIESANGRNYFQWLMKLGSEWPSMGVNRESWTGLLGLFSVLATFFSLVYTLYRKNPKAAVLLRHPSALFTINKFEKKVNFYESFRRSFRETCRALDRPVTIFIDDLDRCNPKAIQTVLETVNFLMTVSPIYVVLGMDWERVKQALAVDLKSNNGEKDVNDQGSAKIEKASESQAEYFLEKLVNIRVAIPKASHGFSKILLSQPPSQLSEKKSWLFSVTHFILFNSRKRSLKIILGQISSILLSFYLYNVVKNVDLATISPTAENSSGIIINSDDPGGFAKPPLPSEEIDHKAFTFIPGNHAEMFENWIIMLISISLLIIWLLLPFRPRDIAIKDTPTFYRAIKDCEEVLGHEANTKGKEAWTPRRLKRFVNHARLVATRARNVAEPDPRSFIELVKLWWHGTDSHAMQSLPNNAEGILVTSGVVWHLAQANSKDVSQLNCPLEIIEKLETNVDLSKLENWLSINRELSRQYYALWSEQIFTLGDPEPNPEDSPVDPL